MDIRRDMTSLIIALSSGKGTWQEVNSIISNPKWEKIYLLCNSYSYEKFKTVNPKILKLNFDSTKFEENYKKLSTVLKKQIKDFEIAINLSSGTGIEHMSIISAVQRAGLGFRFIYLKNKEIKEFEILDVPKNYEIE